MALGVLTLFNPATVYLYAPLLWDSIIYLMIFLGISQTVFTGPKFGKSGKTISIGIGLALSISMILFESRSGFRIGSVELSMLPFIILFAVITFFFYRLFSELFNMNPPCTTALSFIITSIGLFPIINNNLLQAKFFDLMLTLLLIASIIELIICISQFFSGHHSEDTESRSAEGPAEQLIPNPPIVPTPHPEPDEPDFPECNRLEAELAAHNANLQNLAANLQTEVDALLDALSRALANASGYGIEEDYDVPWQSFQRINERITEAISDTQETTRQIVNNNCSQAPPGPQIDEHIVVFQQLVNYIEQQRTRVRMHLEQVFTT